MAIIDPLEEEKKTGIIDPLEVETPSDKSVSGFISNVGSNAIEAGKGIVTAVSHPFQTAENVGATVGRIARGGMEKITGIPAPSEARETFATVSEPVKKAIAQPLRIPGMVFDYAYENPVDTAMMVSGATGLAGKAAKAGGLSRTAKVAQTVASATDPFNLTVKAVKPVVGGVKRAAKEIEGTLTGGGPGFIEEAAKGSPAFTKAMRGKITGEEIVKHAKESLQSLRDKRGNVYRTELQKVRATPGTLPQVVTDLKQELTTLMAPDEFQITIQTTPKGGTKLDFSQSPLVKNQSVIKRAIEDVNSWTDESALGLDNLKKRLSKYVDQVEKQSPAEVFLTRLEKSLSGGLRNAIPEYEGMTRGYAEATNLIKDIESNLMLRKEGMTGRITADNTLRRLSSALRENFEMRKDLLQTLGNKSGMDIPAEVAGYIANHWIPRGTWGKFFSAAGGAYFLKYINPKIWPVVLASSPRVVGEFLNAYGQAAKSIGKPIGKALEIGTKPEILAPVGFAGRAEKPVPDFSLAEE